MKYYLHPFLFKTGSVNSLKEDDIECRYIKSESTSLRYTMEFGSGALDNYEFLLEYDGQTKSANEIPLFECPLILYRADNLEEAQIISRACFAPESPLRELSRVLLFPMDG